VLHSLEHTFRSCRSPLRHPATACCIGVGGCDCPNRSTHGRSGIVASLPSHHHAQKKRETQPRSTPSLLLALPQQVRSHCSRTSDETHRDNPHECNRSDHSLANYDAIAPLATELYISKRNLHAPHTPRNSHPHPSRHPARQSFDRSIASRRSNRNNQGKRQKAKGKRQKMQLGEAP